MFFVTGKNNGTDLEHYGKTVIFSQGIAHSDGEYYLENGYTTRHKAELELNKIKRFHENKSSEKWIYSIVDRDIVEPL